MAKIETLADVPNVAPLNGNNDKIETAFQNTLSRDGSTPNQMEANLDMNNNRILNLPDAVHNQEPITLAQAASIAAVDTAFSRENVGAVLYPRTAAEIAASVTPTAAGYAYPPGVPERYGAVGDGVTDDTVAIESALSVGGIVTFAKGATYKVTTITIPASTGLVLEGNNAAIITSEKIAIEFGGTVSDCEIRGLRISTTESSATGVYGLISGINKTLSNIRIIGCRFTGSTSATNGIKFDNTTDGTTLDGLLVQGCDFANIGRMGVEVINHTFDDVARYFNVRVIGNRFDGLGKAEQYGMAVSLSGLGKGCVIANNTAEDCRDIAFENAGAHQLTISGNTARNLQSGCDGIYVAKPVTATDKLPDIAIVGNVIESNGGLSLQVVNTSVPTISGNTITGTGKVSIELCDSLTMAGNNFQVTNQILFTDCTAVAASGCRFKCLGTTAGYNPTISDTTLSVFAGCVFESARATGLLIDGTSANNAFSGCIFSNESSASAGSPLQFSGASCTGNVVTAPILRRTSAGGATWQQTSSATGNVVALPTANTFNPASSDPYATALTLATAANAYLHTVKMNGSYLWVDSTGDLRIKSSAPASDTDGTIVGTQS